MVKAIKESRDLTPTVHSFSHHAKYVGMVVAAFFLEKRKPILPSSYKFARGALLELVQSAATISFTKQAHQEEK